MGSYSNRGYDTVFEVFLSEENILFITNEEIQAKQREQRMKLKDTPEFQQMLRHVSDLVKTEMEYRHQKNAELKSLWLQIFMKK